MARSASKNVTIEGVRPVIEALRAGRRQVYDVILPSGGVRSSPGQRQLEALLRERGIPATRKSGVGVSARVDVFPEEPFESLLGSEHAPLLVALDRVTDVGNLGSIARSAEVAGASGLILEDRHSPPIGGGALRASAGALEHLRVGRAPNLRRALEFARSEGFAILIGELDGLPIERIDEPLLCGPLIWVFGSEDRGPRPSVRELASQRVSIPVEGRVESLGVAAAAAHLLLRTAEVRRKS
ncbi:MAG: RNA methyltransferase [bacterium]|nr:RNA methyltransferase [bacterium]